MKYYSYILNIILIWVIFKMYNHYNEHYKKIDNYNFFGIELPTIQIKNIEPTPTVVNPSENNKDVNEESFSEEQYLESILENGSVEYQDSKLTESEYSTKKNNIIKILTNNFSIRQLQCINKIYMIDWEELDDDASAYTMGIENYKENNIFISTDNNGYYKSSILHEVWHCIHNSHMTYFNKKYSAKWENMNDYVSDYAKTSILEDVAETGMYYCEGNINNENGKFGLIKQFYEDTK